MSAIRATVLSGDPYVDGLIGPRAWSNATLTFSFPATAASYGPSYGIGEPEAGFGALGATQKAAVRLVLDAVAGVANLTFQEVSSGDAVLRFGRTTATPTAHAYLPDTSDEGGDVWFARDGFDETAPSGYDYFTALHEIGHALGLVHPHEGTPLPIAADSLEFSVMSYRSYVGASSSSGYTNERWSFPKTPMMYDIAALQYLYGANYETNAGNTLYAWRPDSGQLLVDGAARPAPGGNRIFETIWDGGGTDEFDFSAFATDLDIDLRPGRWSTTSSAQIADLHYDGSKPAIGNIATALLFAGDTRSLIENAIGGTGDDRILGNVADNRLSGGGGSDFLDGDGGHDTALFQGLRGDFHVAWRSGQLEVVDLRHGSGGDVDTLVRIETLRFDDGDHAAAAFGTGGFSHDGSWTGAGQGADGWYVGDFDGDGRDDIFRYVPGRSGAEVFLSAGDSFSFAGSWTGFGSGDRGWYVGDFDGDGRDDIFRYVSGRSGAEMLLSTGSGFSFAGSWTGFHGGDHGWYVGDFDGDGRDDLFRYVSGRSGAEVLLSTGTGFVHAGSWTGSGSSGWTLGDFDGDGRDDILRQVGGAKAQVLLSTGGGFAGSAEWLDAGDRLGALKAGDFDGDGRDDILDATSREVHLSSGASLFSTGEWANVAADWHVGDFDGNGSDDIFRYLPGETGADMWLA